MSFFIFWGSKSRKRLSKIRSCVRYLMFIWWVLQEEIKKSSNVGITSKKFWSKIIRLMVELSFFWVTRKFFLGQQVMFLWKDGKTHMIVSSKKLISALLDLITTFLMQVMRFYFQQSICIQSNLFLSCRSRLLLVLLK